MIDGRAALLSGLLSNKFKISVVPINEDNNGAETVSGSGNNDIKVDEEKEKDKEKEKEAVDGIPLKDDPIFSKYFKMLKVTQMKVYRFSDN